jgi:hypothetical protein
MHVEFVREAFELLCVGGKADTCLQRYCRKTEVQHMLRSLASQRNNHSTLPFYSVDWSNSIKHLLWQRFQSYGSIKEHVGYVKCIVFLLCKHSRAQPHNTVVQLHSDVLCIPIHLDFSLNPHNPPTLRKDEVARCR